MAFKAGIAPWFQLEVPEMKRDPLAALANQHLARGTGKFADSAGRNLVWFNLGVFPTEICSAENALSAGGVALCRRVCADH